MFKYLILALMLLLAVPAVAVEGNGPDYYQISASGEVLLNANYLTTPAPLVEGYIFSEDGTFRVVGYRYNRNTGAFVKVFPNFSLDTASLSVFSPVGFVLPIKMKVDKLTFSEVTGVTNLIMYK